MAEPGAVAEALGAFSGAGLKVQGRTRSTHRASISHRNALQCTGINLIGSGRSKSCYTCAYLHGLNEASRLQGSGFSSLFMARQGLTVLQNCFMKLSLDTIVKTCTSLRVNAPKIRNVLQSSQKSSSGTDPGGAERRHGTFACGGRTFLMSLTSGCGLPVL